MTSNDVRLERPLRVGLITNPASGRVRRILPDVRALAQDAPEVAHREARDPEDVVAALEALSHEELDVLAVNGGDGTVQAVLTGLFRGRHFDKLPALAILPGGTSNVTAADVGCRGRLPDALRRVLALGEPGRGGAVLAPRPVLRVAVSSAEPARYGMVFGAGAIVKGIEYCHGQVYKSGVRGALVPGLCTLRVLVAMAREDARYVAPVPMAVAASRRDGPARFVPNEQEYLLLLASALERLFLGLRPYWGEEHGAFYFTSIRSRPAHALRTLPQLLWGRAGRTATPENGYCSEKLDELRVDMDGPITLDGEIYQVSRQTGPVRITVGGWVNFLQI